MSARQPAQWPVEAAALAPRPAGWAAGRRTRVDGWRVPAGLAVAALWLLATLALRPLALPDEGRYVGVAWEMLRSGHWLVPTLDGLPFFHKPPLFYWLAAAGLQWFGPGVWAARLGSWLAAAGTAVALHGFLRRWAGPQSARRTTVVLVTTPLFFGGAQYANMDMLVAGCIAGCLLAVAHATLAREHGQTARRALAAAFALAALGVLAKGLIGIVLPLAAWLAWAAARGRLRAVPPLLFWGPGWVIFTALAAPWFVAVQARHPGFAHYFFVVQHLQRFMSGGFNNPQPAWFYPAVLALTALPWTPWLLALARRRWWQRPDPQGLRALMLVWLGVVTVFFSLPESKLVGYILPALPPLAWLVADAASSGARPRGRAFALTAALAAAVCAGAVTAAHFRQPKSEQALAQRLAAERRPGDAVVFVGRYFYDVPVYARLADPVFVVDDWSGAATAADSWRRELLDAAAFAPGAATPLLHATGLDAATCRAARVWVVAPWPAAAPALPSLAGRAPLLRSADAALWRIDRGAAACAGPVAVGY